MIQVYAIGTPVFLGPHREHVQATVTGVSIRGEGHVAYECAWWDGRKRETAWIEACEVCHDGDPEYVRIGFADAQEAA